MPRSYDLGNLAESLFVFGQENGFSINRFETAPNDRFDVDLLCVLIKTDGSVERVGIGQSDDRHLEIFQPEEQLRDVEGPFQQRKCAVNMKMNERCHGKNHRRRKSENQEENHEDTNTRR